MKIEILTRNELARPEIESLWAQGVNMDDWDYIVLAPPETIESREEKETYSWGEDEESCIVWDQMEPTLDRLLTGSCSNEWYRATFRGTEYAVGVAYHA